MIDKREIIDAATALGITPHVVEKDYVLGWLLWGIDNQKGRGNDRIGKRARQTYSLFREVILSEHGDKLIREAEPQVRLLVEPSCLPSPALTDRLDYSKADDETVGCLHAYKEQNPESDARLLTHDSGPMASAKMLSLPFVPAPDDWLIPPESDKAEREKRQPLPAFPNQSCRGPRTGEPLRFQRNPS